MQIVCPILRVFKIFLFIFIVSSTDIVHLDVVQLFIFFSSHVLLESLEEKAVAPHSSTLAWTIPWAEEPGRLGSMGSLRVGHD